MTATEAWWTGARVGTGPTVEELYAAHAAGAVRLAFLLTGDRAEADDIAQESFLAAAARIGTLRNPDRFGAYLNRAVVRRVLTEHRTRTRALRRMERVAPREGAPDASDHVAEEMVLDAAMDALSARQRAVIVLRFWHDLSETEIARTIGCRPGTVKSTLSRALEILRQEVHSDD